MFSKFLVKITATLIIKKRLYNKNKVYNNKNYAR